VARGTSAEAALSILTPLEKVPANKIYQSIETSEKVWSTVAVTLDEFIADYVSDGKAPVLSGIRVKGNDQKGGSNENIEMIRPASELQNAGLAAFRKDKLIGWLSEEESKAYNYILNNMKSAINHVACPQGGNIALEVIRSEAEIKGYMDNRRPHIHVELRLEENVGEVQCRIDLTREETIEELEQRAQQSLQRILDHAVKQAQGKYKADIFGFGNALHRSDPKAWNSFKTDWDKHFEDAVVSVLVNVKIKQIGTVTDSFFEKGKK
jgi:spore germination protein KC